VTLPTFRYHPDPVASGSVVRSDATCECCGDRRGYLYAGPVYSEAALESGLCPWCIADGSAHRRYEATFVDTEAFAESTPGAVIDEISQRTPGYSAWQAERWPECCGDATAFLGPMGIKEIREGHRELEGSLLNHIIYEMGISGGAATRLLGSLQRDQGPTVYLFRCLECDTHHFHVDRP
jgi:uncharacterized protein